MTKEEMMKKIRSLEYDLAKEQAKVESCDRNAFYEGKLERCYLYDEIFTFIKDHLGSGGEIILRPRNAEIER